MKNLLLIFIIFFNFSLLSQELDIFVPNSFTPNKSTNKEFFPVTKSSYILEVYNRWGELIFKGERWNGKQNNQDCPVGTYIWVITIDEKKHIGYLNLL